ncbi:MAG: chloromuconate cycloisomerase, partial [Candidatus Rokuibacteriota bacterium]
MALRIAGIEPILVDVPLREPVHGVHGVTTMQHSVLVRVTSDDGVEGWGNVDPTPGYSAMSAAEIHDTVRRIGPTLTGTDPFNVRRALAAMDRAAPGRYEAIAAVEM